jgi:hypothetical protein
MSNKSNKSRKSRKSRKSLKSKQNKEFYYVFHMGGKNDKNDILCFYKGSAVEKKTKHGLEFVPHGQGTLYRIKFKGNYYNYGTTFGFGAMCNYGDKKPLVRNKFINGSWKNGNPIKITIYFETLGYLGKDRINQILDFKGNKITGSTYVNDDEKTVSHKGEYQRIGFLPKGKGIIYYESGKKKLEGQLKIDIVKKGQVKYGDVICTQGIVYYPNGKKKFEGELISYMDSLQDIHDIIIEGVVVTSDNTILLHGLGKSYTDTGEMLYNGRWKMGIPTNLNKYYNSYDDFVHRSNNTYTMDYKSAHISITIKNKKWSATSGVFYYPTLIDKAGKYSCDIHLDLLFSNSNTLQPKVERGITRKMFCWMLDAFLKSGKINNNSIISLEAMSSTNNNLVKKVYIPMGFKMIAPSHGDKVHGGGLMMSSVKKVLKWCDYKYRNKIYKNMKIKSKNYTYVGGVNDKGEPHGTGATEMNNYKVYVGEWKNGLYHGKGVLYKRGKIEHKGKWIDGIYQATIKDASSYIGSIGSYFWNLFSGKK